MKAGLAEIDITPPVGCLKIGWLKEIVTDRVLDPLFARVAVFESGEGRVAFVQLDTLSVRWTTVNDIRSRVQERFGFPGANVMVSATHNHCGPAMANCGDVKRDDAYLAQMTEKVVGAFGQALEQCQEAELGFAHVFEFGLSHNRRVVIRDGTVKTHGSWKDPMALYVDGPIDPEVAVLAARAQDGKLLGCLVNYACHPTHHGGTGALTGGYPGALAREMKSRGCPVTPFLNGACGNISSGDSARNFNPSMEDMGRKLADDAFAAIGAMAFQLDVPLAAASTTLQLPYRQVSDDEAAGKIRGAQRFVDPTAYDRGIPGLLRRIRERGAQPAEVQALRVGDAVFASVPAEYFVQLGLRIKVQSHPAHALVVSCANGMVGYVPTKDAFERGGYETTFAPSSRMAPETGDLLADAAISLIRFIWRKEK